MKETETAPRTHSANEPNEPTAGSDSIEDTTQEGSNSLSSNITLCDCSLILLRET